MKALKLLLWIILAVVILSMAVALMETGPLKQGGSAVSSSDNSSSTAVFSARPGEIGHMKIGGRVISVELAKTMAEQILGLSGRESLAPDTGMLFVFAAPGKYGFWMKDMKFPIDMIWLAPDLSVVYIKENATPSSYPETFSPGADAKYVLEVNSGFSAQAGIKIGDKAELLP